MAILRSNLSYTTTRLTRTNMKSVDTANMIKVRLYEFSMGDVEDPELYAAQTLYRWRETEHGRWCDEHCSDMTWHTMLDVEFYGYKCVVVGYMAKQDYTFYNLKWKTI